LILLAFDTSANFCSAALYDCGKRKILSQKSENIGRGHAERLMGLLADVLQSAGLEYKDVNRIAANCGPGSFTGIRVGLATARGLALGLNIPVIGVNALEAIAFQHNNSENNAREPIVVALDAKRGEVFAQIFSCSGEPLSMPRAVALDQIKDFMPDQPVRIAGSGCKAIINAMEERSYKFCSDQTAANIEDIAKLAAQLADSSNKPLPLYLRSADAKPQNNFAVARVSPVPHQQAAK
jgi:tRNA threonylcarbamoyladenosine biosynthesis protein TsaB